jgi:uncharacterized protein YceK
MRIRTAIVASLATGALLTGCSSSSDKPDAKPSTAPTTATAAPTTAGSDDKAALLAAVQAYTAAFFKPDADRTFALLSARCQQGTSAAEMKQVLAASAQAYGKPTVKSTEVNALSGDLARVTVHYVHPPMKETPQDWTREGGQWKFDACH